MKIVTWLRAILAPLVLMAAVIFPAHASLVTVDLLTDNQFVLSTGPTVSNTLTQGLGELPGAISQIGTRTIAATMTGGIGFVAASVGGGVFGCDRSVTALGACSLKYVIDEAITLSRVLGTANTDLTGVGSAVLEFWVNNAQVWTHTMIATTESFDIPFALTTFGVGSSFELRNSGGNAGTDISAAKFKIEGPNRVSEPGSLALFGLGMLGIAGITRRQRKVMGRAAA